MWAATESRCHRVRVVAVSEDFEIRPARPEEYPAIGALTVDVYVGDGYIHPESPYVPELSDTESRARVAEIMVAVRGGIVLGSLTVARPGTPYANVAGPDEIEFRMLAVAKRARGSGVGTALVRTVIRTARAEGFAAVALTTMPPMVDARRMYERLGFVHVPERDWVASSGTVLTVMRLDLA
ncbi:GNAT family N-acetyltransferase [Nocardia terpenica]|nr:GNAT family N-acetyltransferase [Nocardia terpenica]MBF6107862.1 GNAT family N-acetyltransferase [Nocardia terpenica]MBF6114930.1 GNAT family N-acetyltransferase [Nocardia terpenica]MBF6121083.1 GNAT family N-acetyltransferase [Nocardia terpenica]MBF6153375.1 GNAT family N-acetyltransferase [Nocardia terpenica]